jgi:hypothetical protein
MDITFDQGGYGFFDMLPHLYGETLNELISFATDLESAF